MDYEKLIDEIILEVKGYLNQNSRCKKKITLLGELHNSSKSALEQEFDFISYEEGIYETDFILIAELTIPMLANIGSGCCRTDEEAFVLKALLEGKPVFVLEENIVYRKYKKTAHRNLYALYAEYEKRMTQYGVRIISDVGCILKEIYKEENETQSRDLGHESNKAKVNSLKKLSGDIEVKQSVPNDSYGEELNMTAIKLLSETELKRLNHGGFGGIKSVTLNRHCIITPSAIDYIRDHEIHIERV